MQLKILAFWKEFKVMILCDNMLAVARENLEGLDYTQQVTDWDEAVARVRKIVMAFDMSAMEYLLENPPEVTGVHPSLKGNARLVSGDYPINPFKYKRKSISGKQSAAKAIKKKPVAAKQKPAAKKKPAAQKKVVRTSISGKKATTTPTLKKPSASIANNKIFVQKQSVSVKKEPTSA